MPPTPPGTIDNPPPRSTSSSGGRRIVRIAGTLAVMGLLGWAIVASGTARDMAATLVVIGFDPDRAQLIGGLVIEALLVGLGVVTFAAVRPAIVIGVIAFAADFRQVFVQETQDAMRASGPQGTFDPTGWVLTAGTLGLIAFVVAWSAATLFGLVRRHLIDAGRDARLFVSGDRSLRRLARPAAALAVTLALVVTLPVFGDMVNYEPDARMRHGAASGPALSAEGPRAQPAAGAPSLPPDLLVNGGVYGPGPLPASPTGVLSSATPWLAWRPAGQGSIVTVSAPAPWAGDPPPTTSLSVYLPPGYDSGTVRYPVIYSLPFPISSWTAYVQLPALLDNLVDGGAIPPEIVVFVAEYGGPYADSECANSYDGREWFERNLVTSIIPMIDARYRTIADAAARSVMGYSQGGFCAPMLTLRHPDVFGSSISFSGYFQAGIRSGQTPNAWIPFHANPSAEAAVSPLMTAARVAPSLRSTLFFELSAGPTQPFYGPQYTAFARTLAGARIPFALFPTPLGHAWNAVRLQMPSILETLAARQTELGVFGA
jgi:enterochelin esterase-like enzyme